MDPILNEELRKQMNVLAKFLDEILNGEDVALKRTSRKYGFALLTFDFGSGGRMNWISNANRADMLVALKELIANFEGRAIPPGRG